MTESKFVGAFWVLLCFIPAVMAHVNGGSYECIPAYSWNEGENVTIKFRIDRNKYPSECAGTPNGRAVFQSSPDGVTAYSTECQLPDDIQTSCPSSSSNHPCRCTDSNDNGFFVIEYNFVATANIDRWWRADIACQLVPSLQPALHFSSIGCLNGITIVTPTTSAPTTPAPTTIPPEPDDNTGFLVGIAILIVIVIILLTIVILQAMRIIKPCCVSDSPNATATATATAKSYFDKATQIGPPGDPNGPQN